MKKIVVTGAAGFLGSHLTRQLLSQQHQVFGIDSLSSGLIANLQEELNHPRFEFRSLDVSKLRVDHLDHFGHIDEIYHLASPASPKFYQMNPFSTIEANTLGTQNMLELAKVHGAKLLYTSTSEAYGDPEVHPQTEQYRGNVNTWGPRACYDEAKRLGEVYCYEYYTRYAVQVKVARIFNTYSAGLRNDDGRVISNFVSQAIRGEDLTVYGDGTQTRSFCFVDDNIRGLQKMMECDQANGEIINIGNPKEYTIIEVAQIVKRLANSPSNITFHPLPIDDPKVRRPNIDKAKTILAWEPLVELEEGLIRTIEMYRNKLKAELSQKIV
ncbi:MULTISPECIES: UDP-glucuronic acid decarboxylase family protein [Paenibacillus]|uniref:NAD-dependent epimerase/dehydratase family protein n=1 Tax=Paenibacillus validus TaxID=44253 RepID=A0A7X2Z9H1_9BACL|nr:MULTISPECIES: UDP-glucuronic acid decarboxylase family protein [Paenibacillus]MUG70829.1 NAD-dependent epimerase/dehydratase family protein [Paenibacillus validus]